MPALILTSQLSNQTALAEAVASDEAPFADGYTGTSETMNSNRQVWTCVWDGIASSDAQTLRDFFRTNRHAETITWTPPDDDTEYDFRITGDLEYVFQGGDARRVSFQMKQIFDDV